MKKLILYFLFILQSAIVFCQINVKSQKGYIIDSNNDTIYGEIMLYPYSDLSTKVDFIEADNNVRKLYTPRDLLGFHIDPDEDFMVITMPGRFRRQTVELKYFGLKVVQGEVELIVVTLNSLKKLYFVYSDDFGLAKLEQEEKISKANSMSGKRYKETYNKYKITLGKYFYKYPVFQHRIDDTKYRYNPLRKLIYDYNAKFEKPSLIIKEDKSIWHLSVFVGGDYNLIDTFIGANKIYGMVFGLKNSFYSDRNNMKTEFVFGLNYRFYTFKKNEKDQRYDAIELPFYFEYNNKMNSLSPIVRFGIRPNFYKGNAGYIGIGRTTYDWTPGFNFIIALGGAINYKRLSIKYLINGFPLLMNSLEVDFRIK